MNVKKILAAALVASAFAVGLSACTQAERVSSNISVEADNFNIVRRLAVINTITGTPLLEMVGRLSIEVDAADEQLEITVKESEDSYKKHFVGLSPTVTYVIEDITGADVSAFRYEVSYLPESIIPIEYVDGSR